MIDFNAAYRVIMPGVERCELALGEEMEEVKVFQYLGTVLGKHREMEGEIRESCERQVCHKVTCKGCERNNVSKRGLRNSFFLPTLTDRSET